MGPNLLLFFGVHNCLWGGYGILLETGLCPLVQEGGHSIARYEDRCVWYRNREEKIKQSLLRITNWSFLMNEMREQALQRHLVCSGVEGSGNRYVDG